MSFRTLKPIVETGVLEKKTSLFVLIVRVYTAMLIISLGIIRPEMISTG